MTIQFLIAIVFGFSYSSENTLIGIWKTELNNSVVKIEVKNNVFEGVIIKSDEPKYIGIKVIKSVYKFEGKYKCQIYDPKVKKYFDATIELINESKLEERASCCLGLFSETYIWERQY